MDVTVPLLRCVVPGEPASKERPRLVLSASGKPHVYTSRKTAAAEQRIASYAVAAGCRPVADVHLGVKVTFHVKRLGARDTDNLVKLLLDGLNGVAWNDDRQVILLLAQQRLCLDSPRTEFEVFTTGRPFTPATPRAPRKTRVRR